MLTVAVGLLACASLTAVAEISPTEIERVSLPNTAGAEGNAASFGPLSVSGTGRFVAFSSRARNFYGPDTNNILDIYVRDRIAGFTFPVSLGNPPSNLAGRVLGNGDSSEPDITGDGRFVAFQSLATNLVTGDTNAASDVFVRDRNGDALRVSVNDFGGQGPNGAGSFAPSISDPALDVSLGGLQFFVAYHSDANNLDGVDTNTVTDVFLTEVAPDPFFGGFGVQETVRISRAPDGSEGDGESLNASISKDGRYVVYESGAENLTADDGNGFRDIFLYDRVTDENTRITAVRDDQGQILDEADGDSHLPAISPDGRFIAFVTDATVFDPSDSGLFFDVYVYDRLFNTFTRVSVDSLDNEGDADSGIITDQLAQILRDGRPAVTTQGASGDFLCAFASEAENLDLDGNQEIDVFVYDSSDATTIRVSTAGGQVEDGFSSSPGISDLGNLVAFDSGATNLIFDDNNLFFDVFALGTGIAGLPGDQAPVADAGLDQVVFETDLVVLDGTGSFDPEVAPLTYQWTQIDDGSPLVELDDPTSDQPSFIAPPVPGPVILTFQLVVSDGANTSEPDEVEILVDVAPAAVVQGVVTDSDFNPIFGAQVHVIREDGEEADGPVFTDAGGNYVVNNVRAGFNTVTVSAPGFEPHFEDVELAPAEVLVLDVQLASPTGSLLGEVRLADGTAVLGAIVTLRTVNGDTIATTNTDAAGEYLLDDLDFVELDAAGSLEVNAAPLAPWVVSDFDREAGEANRRDFRFGTLRVNVRVSAGAGKKAKAQAKKLENQLNNTSIQVLIGETLAATGFASKKIRQVTFPNLPALPVRVRGKNNALTGQQVSVTIVEGPTVTRVTITFQPIGVF